MLAAQQETGKSQYCYRVIRGKYIPSVAGSTPALGSNADIRMLLADSLAMS
jgi:hypothetical protein